MQHRLEVRAFFFNAKTDYLPYYKNFIITLDGTQRAEAILSEIQKQNDEFVYPNEKLLFKINDLVVQAGQSINSLVERLGLELQIDPILSYRSNNCLIINDDDFMKSFELLAPYASEEDKKYYESLYSLHYASETFKFSHDYIGDAVLLLAYRMIENGSEHKEEIIKAISDEYDGLESCEYENNFFNPEYHAKAIASLKSMNRFIVKSSILDKFAQKLSKKALTPFEKDNIEGLNVACYAGDSEFLEEVNNKIKANLGKPISFSREKRLAGTSLVGRQNNLAFLKAARTLLDALDSGAELLVVVKDDDIEMFRTNFASIQKRIGRDIALPMVSYKEFKELVSKENVA